MVGVAERGRSAQRGLGIAPEVGGRLPETAAQDGQRGRGEAGLHHRALVGEVEQDPPVTGPLDRRAGGPDEADDTVLLTQAARDVLDVARRA